jgi:hypothetical protein
MPQSEESLILSLPNEWAEVLPSQGQGVVELSKQSGSWKIMFEPVIGNDVIYEVAAFMYVVLSKAEKTRTI